MGPTEASGMVLAFIMLTSDQTVGFLHRVENRAIDAHPAQKVGAVHQSLISGHRETAVVIP